MKTKTWTSKKYADVRDSVIKEVLNAIRAEYPNDREILSRAIDLTTTLQVANPNEEFVKDLKGFLIWSSGKDRSSVISTVMHDLREFESNRYQKWFCPRVTGYSKYLTGASNVEV